MSTAGFLGTIGNGIKMILTHPLLYISISLILFVTSTILVSKYIGSKDSWNEIKDQINKIITFSVIGSVILFIALLIYLLQDQEKAVYVTSVNIDITNIIVIKKIDKKTNFL